MLSYILSFTNASRVPTKSPAVVAERYGAFMLPGQAPAPIPQDPASASDSALRRRYLQTVKNNVEKGDGSHRSHVCFLKKGGHEQTEGQATISQFISKVPLAPLWTEEGPREEDDSGEDDVERYRPSHPGMD